MKIIYIAGPFRAPSAWEIEQNVRRAEELAFAVAKLGAMPLTPHMNTRHFHGTLPDQFWIDGTLELVRRCNAMILVPGWEYSVGACGERAEMLRLGRPAFTTLGALAAWLESTA